MTRQWRLAVPLTVLVALHLASLLGGFIAPHSAVKQNRNAPWARPTALHFIDSHGRFHVRPFVFPQTPHPQDIGAYVENRTIPCSLRFLVRGDPYDLLGLVSTDLHLFGADPPANLHLLGTDGFGRDVFARILVGGRTSLFTGLLAAGAALLLGTIVGVTSGFLGGRTDKVLMRVAELFLALPWLYLLLGLRAFLPLNLPPISSFLLLILVVGLIGWARPARLLRGVALTARERLFVTAAHGSGVSLARILKTHVLPQAYQVVATQAAILIPTYVLAEVTLSFLGLGISEPQPSWGNILASLHKYHVLANYYWMLLPSLPLLAAFLAYYALSRRMAVT